MSSDSKLNRKFTIPILSTVVAFVAIVIMLGLGFWQLERKLEKEQRLENIEKASKSEALDLGDIAQNLTKFQDYEVRASGDVIHQYFLIDNKLRMGQPGYHVLVPYQTEFGVIILNYGWLAATGVRAELPTLRIPNTESIQGIVYIPLDNTLVKETNERYGEFPALLQQVDLTEIENHLNTNVMPAVVRLLPDESDFIREWQAVTMSPEKHLAYAVQWFGLAVAGLTIYLLSMLKKMHAPKPGAN